MSITTKNDRRCKYDRSESDDGITMVLVQEELVVL